ncbi:MAG: hypothetical protein HUU21_28335 [Polyangiaceae bacterium]|nr:hypothetical protein [Polyangiaceae bacterium]NUQ77465.1 hypothetical protein [Polyangiaceae bacterium]
MPRTTTAARISWIACAALLVAAPSVALAQAEDNEFDKGGDDVIAADKQAKEERKTGAKMPGEKDKKAEEEAVAKAARSENDPREDPLKTYYFVGLRFRDVIVPKFMMNIFSDGGATVNVFTFGPELTSRKNGIEYDIGLSYADYSMNEFLFKGNGEGDESWEIVSSDMKVIYVNIDILFEVWKHDSGMFSFMVGGGVGLGGVLGNLYRTQAFPDDTSRLNTDDVSAWNKCTGPSDQPLVAGSTIPYCDKSNTHFRVNGEDYSEPSWANGGAKPFIFPWLAIPQVSFRYKPVKQFQARADLGFSITGFYFGLSAAYGL